jgi:hypothetical protein
MADWLTRIKETMAIDLTRFMGAGLPPKALIEKLFDIPEVAQAFQLRERGKLGIDMDTPEGQAIAAERLAWVAEFLDDGFHERTVEEIKGIAADLTTAPAVAS